MTQDTVHIGWKDPPDVTGAAIIRSWTDLPRSWVFVHGAWIPHVLSNIFPYASP